MKNILFLILSFSLSLFSLSAQNYQKIDGGIVVTVQKMNIEVKCYSDEIVRVSKKLEGTVFQKTSLSVIKTPASVQLTYSQNGQIISLVNKKLKIDLNLETGRVLFLDVNGIKLFTEKDFGAQFTNTTDVDKATYIVRQAFMLDNAEAIYGLGQQQNGQLNQRGQKFQLKNDNMKVSIPFFQSNKGYGIFWDNYSSTVFNDNPQELSLESLGDGIDYYFLFGGNGDGVVAQMRDLTGQAPMLPLWTYGYWQSRERYKNQAEIVEVVEKYRSLGVPLDGIVQDWQYWGADSVWNAMSFDPKTFAEPQKMVDRIHQLNAHLMIVAWPGFGPLTAQYKELMSKKMMIDFETWPPKSGTKPYDPFNPAARDIYWNYLNKGVFSFNTDAWWLDSSEPDHINIKEQDFDQPTYLGSYRSVVNAYPLMHVKGVYEHQRATTSDKRVCILTRSAFAGQQRFGANTWSGDIVASWKTFKKQIPAGLSLSCTGIPYWNADIGGFFLKAFNGRNALKNIEFHELYVRWLQFGAFTPMMRSHGTDAPREIYQFGKKGEWAYDAIEKYIKLRYSLLPYIYSTAWGVTSRSESILRPLFMDFSSDEKVLNIATEYMFGKSILVVPVTDKQYTVKQDKETSTDFSKVKTTQVYLPKGVTWYDFWTNEKIEGGQTIDKATSVDVLPLYVKAGSIVPFGPDVQYAEEKKWNQLTLRVYPGVDGEFMLYEDDNNNYNYENGAYSTINFTWNNTNRTMTIGERKGKFPGMLKNRTFNIVLVDVKNGVGVKASTSFAKTISYNGKSKTVKF